MKREMALPNLTPALHTYPPLVSQLSRKELHLIYKSWVQLQGVSKIGNNMSFYRWTPVRCERPQGVTLALGQCQGESLWIRAIRLESTGDPSHSLTTPALVGGARVVPALFGRVTCRLYPRSWTLPQRALRRQNRVLCYTKITVTRQGASLLRSSQA